jgi:integrase
MRSSALNSAVGAGHRNTARLRSYGIGVTVVVRHRRIKKSVGRQLADLTGPFENAPPPYRRSSWPRHAHHAITVLAEGRRFIDKRYLGIRIGLRVGAITQEQAEERLEIEIARVHCDLARKAHARPTFTDCAARYVAQSRGQRSIDVIKWHVWLLESYIGTLEPQQIHDATLESFVSARLAAGACATTINRSLEVVRTILNRAARSYRDADGRPWLEAIPPLITMLPETPRSPYPITWKEQDTLFRKLPPHLGRMALFAVNTGLRDSNVCGLQWTWEVVVPEVERSVFVIPAEAFKTKRPHVVILNDVAWSIIEAQRGVHPIWVFPFRGRRINTMNNSGWQDARRDAGLPLVRIHDLRHSFACRLRAAGVSAEDREALLGHANHSMAGHYASADVGHLLKQANLLLDRSGTRTVLRVADSQRGRVDKRSHRVLQQARRTWFCRPSA